LEKEGKKANRISIKLSGLKIKKKTYGIKRKGKEGK